VSVDVVFDGAVDVSATLVVSVDDCVAADLPAHFIATSKQE